MKFSEKLQKGFTLARQAFGIIGQIKHLYMLPVLSGLATIGVIALYCTGLYAFSGDIETTLANLEKGSMYSAAMLHSIAMVAIAYVFLFVSQFITIFFNVATMAAVREYLAGRPSSVKIGLQFAKRRINVIFKWACCAFLITVILGRIEQSLNNFSRLGGSITSYFLGATIGIATYFILPVLAFNEDTTISGALKTSAKMMKEKFSENISAKLYLAAITTVFTLAIAAIFFVFLFLTPFIGILTNSPTLMLVIFLSLLALFIGSFVIITMYTGLVSNILNVALYNYAQDGELTDAIDSEFIVVKR